MGRVVLVLLLVISAVAFCSAISASYGQPLTVVSASTTYDFPGSGIFGSAGTRLVVSSNSAFPNSYVIVNRVNSAPSALVNFNGALSTFGLPAGYSLISGADVGYYFNFSSDLESSQALSAVFTTPASNGLLNLGSQGRRLSLLSFDASTSSYNTLSDSQYSLAANGSISVRLGGSVQLIVASLNLRAIAVNFTNSLSSNLYVLSNSSQSFAFYQGDRLSFTLSNLNTLSGGLTVSLSANAATYASLAASSGLVLVSPVYTISSGANASASASVSASATLSYNLLSSSSSNFTTNAAQWYSLSSSNLATLGGSLSGSVVSQNVASLSGDFAVASTVSFTTLSPYNTSLSVSANAGVFFFGRAAGLGPVLYTSATSATASSSVSVSVIAQLPSINFLFDLISRAFSLPCGFSSLASFTGQQGFNIAVSADLSLGGSFSGRLVTSAIVNYRSIVASGWSVVPLSFSASANVYTALNAGQYQVAANGSVSISISGSAQIILAIYNPRFCIANVLNTTTSKLLLAANLTQSFTITGLGRTSIVVSNLVAQAGALSVSISSNAAAEAAIAAESGRDLLSSIFTLTHSAGASAIISGNLSFSLPGRDCPNNNQPEDSSYEYPPQYDPGNGDSGKKRQVSAGASVSAQSLIALQRQSSQLYFFNNVTAQWQLVVGGQISSSGCILTVPFPTSFSLDFSIQASAIISAAYSTALQVQTSPIIYSFGSNLNATLGLVPALIISSSIASNSSIIFSPINFLPNISAGANTTTVFNLPSGYCLVDCPSIPRGFSLGVSADLSASASAQNSAVGAGAAASFSASLQIPSIICPRFGRNLVLLSFNASAQAFTELSADKYAIAADGSLSVALSVNIGTLYFGVRNCTANRYNFNINVAAYFYVSANSSQSFIIEQDASAAVTLSNVVAASGVLTISGSANAQVQAGAVVSGNALVSDIYSFNHSGGASAVSSARLAFNASAAVGVDVNSLAWYRFNTSSGAWDERQTSIEVSGSTQLVVANTNGFSDYSVQSRSTASSSTGTTSAGSGLRVNGALKRAAQLLM